MPGGKHGKYAVCDDDYDYDYDDDYEYDDDDYDEHPSKADASDRAVNYTSVPSAGTSGAPASYVAGGSARIDPDDVLDQLIPGFRSLESSQVRFLGY